MHECVFALLRCTSLHFTSEFLPHPEAQKEYLRPFFSVFLWSVLSISLLLGFVFHCRLSLLLSLLHDVLNASRVGHKLSRPSCCRVAFKKSAPKESCLHTKKILHASARDSCLKAAAKRASAHTLSPSLFFPAALLLCLLRELRINCGHCLLSLWGSCRSKVAGNFS